MTQDEIIEMAIQGHASTRDAIRWAMNQEREHSRSQTKGEEHMTNEEVMTLMTDMGLHEGGMENWVPDNAWFLFANKVQEKEREACAKLLERTDLGGLKDNPAMQSWVAEMLLAYVKAIRARGQA